ncbi:chromosome segregation SMC family protein [Sphingomonas quercus]|uniref:Chromosome partition protein Smc n=1 Tax=Sphingomonas quercus TaxID=2842451 RepID=A0ABS6BKN1_9SPHN|nr:AAA family ATPase [Sphingomonas quercus]MBU3077991.1 AAA family ATPase [Sphingomonas quercus]
MRIRRLKLAGFKSFVDPAELHIHPGLTGVVGPNGCGKSNLLEAIRWVMGEGSARSLRGGAMDDVIFAGTAQRPARDFAEVSLLVDGAGDEGEAEVVRRIERGAGSAYRINGRDVRAKDVSLLFADAATGAHSPALVSQNRIGAVIAARPAERRQMLEEAAGIAGLHVRRRDAEQKLRATEANLSRVDELLGEMEGRAAALRRQARAAERYRALTEAVRLAEGRLLFARWRDAAAAADRARVEAEQATAIVARDAEGQRAAAAHDVAAREALARAREAGEAARERASDAAHGLASLRQEREGLDRRLAQLGQLAEALARDRAHEIAQTADAEGWLARLAEEEALLGRRLAEAEAGSMAAAEALAAAAAALGDAETAHAASVAEQAAARAEARVAAAAAEAARRRVEQVEARSAAIARELAALEDAGPLVAGRDAALARRAAALADGEAAARALAEAEAAQQAATAARDAATARAAAIAATRAALEAEARAVAPPRAAAGPARALDQIRAAPGYERALAAALGDDLAAPLGPGGWQGAAVEASDPGLPDGVPALAAHVTAPPELARRLAQIGVVPTDKGWRLRAGQRIVTLDGSLRRWDGLVARGGGAAAAERLVRANRLAAIEAELPGVRAEAEAAAATQSRAASALAGAAGQIRAAREAAERAAEVARAAGLDADRATLALERLAARRDEQQLNAALAGAERDQAAAALDQALAAEAALPDPAALDVRVAALSATAAAARAAAADRRAEAGMRAMAVSGDRERLTRIRGESDGWRKRAASAARRAAEMAERMAKADAERTELADRPAVLDAAIAAAETEEAGARALAQSTGEAMLIAQAAAGDAERRATAAGETLAAAREARAAAEARREATEARRTELSRAAGERFDCPGPAVPDKLGFAGASVGVASDEQVLLERATAERERLGPVNLVADQELSELESGRDRMAAERDELGAAVNQLRGSIGSLNREGRQRLLAAFEAVDGHFRRLFTTLFEGGQAHLELVDSDDPLEAGLEIMAQPPGKKLAALTLLSGGEQALTAVALIFGLFLTNPAPICVLDEVDAPLDDANIERFCGLLDRMARETDTRYLIVTHNAVTMARMHRLFGVTMVERGVSRLVSVDLGGAARLLAAE